MINLVQDAKHPYWKDVDDGLWNDWRWQQRERVETLDMLEKVVDLTDGERRAVLGTHQEFKMAITPYYLSIMDCTINGATDPVRLQAIPNESELEDGPFYLDDPLGETKDMPVDGVLTHRYPDRVLLYLTHNCPLYCRHCTRKFRVGDSSTTPRKDMIEEAMQYIEKHNNIRDIVVSGGDSLTLSDNRLHAVLERLASIPHVEMCRIGTRNVVTLPQRIDKQFCDMLASIPSRHLSIWCNTHFNTYLECSESSMEAVENLYSAKIPVSNQMVLLKGVNDSLEDVKKLNHTLLQMKIRPYYIYLCDVAKSLHGFQTGIDKGLEIMEGLRQHTSGLALPTLVCDLPGGGGKAPLQNSYLIERNVEREGHDIKFAKLRNYKNDIYYYPESSPYPEVGSPPIEGSDPALDKLITLKSASGSGGADDND